MIENMIRVAMNLDQVGLSDLADRVSARIDAEGIELYPEIALLIAEARRDIKAMSRVAKVVLSTYDDDDDDDDENEDYEEEVCSRCGFPSEDCECERCPECGELMGECQCSRCEECRELIEDCQCDRCPSCNSLIEYCDCECEKCEDCGNLIDRCICSYKDPYYLERLRRAMILGLNIFSKVAPAYRPIADAMGYYLSGNGGERKLDVSIISEQMRKRMIAKALLATDWVDMIESGNFEPVSVLWGYEDYQAIQPGHVQDSFSKQNADKTEPLNYIAGGFTYQLKPRILRGGKTAIDVHLEDVYDFTNKKDDTQTEYDISSISPNQRVLDIAKNLAKRFVGDLVSFSEDSNVATIDDRMFSAMANEGMAQPFTTVIDGTLMVLPPGEGSISDRLIETTVDYMNQFSGKLNDKIVEMIMRIRPGDILTMDPYVFVHSDAISTPMMLKIFTIRNNPDDVRSLTGSLLWSDKGRSVLRALIPLFARIAPGGTRDLLFSMGFEKEIRKDSQMGMFLREMVAEFPYLDPRPPSPPPGTPEASTAPDPIPFNMMKHKDPWANAPYETRPIFQEESQEEQPKYPTGEFGFQASLIRKMVRAASVMDRIGVHDLADRMDLLLISS